MVIEAANGSVLLEKLFLEISQNSLENTCARASFVNKVARAACNFIKKEVFSCEFYEISKNTVFTEHFWTTATLVNHFPSFSHWVSFVWAKPRNIEYSEFFWKFF